MSCLLSDWVAGSNTVVGFGDALARECVGCVGFAGVELLFVVVVLEDVCEVDGGRVVASPILSLDYLSRLGLLVGERLIRETQVGRR